MSSVSRRGFLHGSIGVAAGSALVGAAGMPLLAADEARPQTAGAPPKPADTTAPAKKDEPVDKAPASERLRMALIGCGDRGGSHVGAWSSLPDTELVALCDPDGARVGQYAAQVEKRQGKAPELYEDFRRMLDDKSIDAVSIATNNHWHALATILAVQAGKHVYVEKPVSHNIFEGRRMVEFARHYGKVVQAGTQRRSDPAIAAAMKYIHDGGIGKLLLARALCYKRRKSIGDSQGPQAVPPSVHYGLWLGPAPEKPPMRERFHYDWHWFWDYGNGDLGNQGVHQMDVAQWGVNRTDLPRHVHSIGGRFGYTDDGETPNTQIVWLDYGDNEPKIMFEVRGLETAKVHDAAIGNIFYGTEGYLVEADGAPLAAYWPSGERKEVFSGEGGEKNHFANFVKAVKSNAKPEDVHGDISIGHVSAALCHLGNISYRLGTQSPFSSSDTKKALEGEYGSEATARMMAHLKANGVNLEDTQCRIGRRLEFDPKSERFPSDQEANQLITREYRSPFVVPDKVA